MGVLSVRALRKNFALGPLVAHRAPEAVSKPELEQSAWERGVAQAASAIDPYGLFGPLVTAAGGFAGPLVDALPLAWPLQSLIGAVIGIGVYWLVPTLWAVVVALHAPYVQRDEARTRVASLESALERSHQALASEQRHSLAKQELTRRLAERVSPPADTFYEKALSINGPEQANRGVSEEIRNILREHDRDDLIQLFDSAVGEGSIDFDTYRQAVVGVLTSPDF